MSKQPRAWLITWFALATLISAFLVFQVQPVISKSVLPWFGGSPAVWTTCMLFFQLLLFGGYCYAHLTTRLLPPAWQGTLHLVLILAALLVLPIVPDGSWKPAHGDHPEGRILLILLCTVGLPYFVLAATGPLLQAWFSLDAEGRSPYRLYALSNVGSLAALVTYPLLFEPSFATPVQGRIWSAAFCGFALICGYLAVRLWKIDATLPANSPNADDADLRAAPTPPTVWNYLAWLLFPAFASVILLATTNHVCQDIAVIPFLWVAPLSLYLLTFIICFDREHWYSRRWFGAAAMLSVIALSMMIQFRYNGVLLLEVSTYFAAMFLTCMICHGELVRGKPDPRHLTAFYLTSSGGGALGGIFVALVCPRIFATHVEMQLSLIIAAATAAGVFLCDRRNAWLLATRQRRLITALGCLAVLLLVGPVHFDSHKFESVAARRNFYGMLAVKAPEGSRGFTLVHGRTVHGFQFDHPRLKYMPTTYDAPESGVGLTLRYLRDNQPLRVGAVGLGCGTIAAYARPGDHYRFYEINPAVVDLAREHFSYLENCEAETEIVLGDGRLSLEREPSQQFDVLVLDAFSSDSIPTHLLTREAFDVYRQHLKHDGVIAVHISNRNLKLEPVVLRLAEHLRMQAVKVENRQSSARVVLPAEWMLITRNESFLNHEQLDKVAWRFSKQDGQEFTLWTDQYNNLFQILKIF